MPDRTIVDMNSAHIDDRLQVRSKLQQQVFQPDFNLPPMSLEEFAENEMREAIEREAKQAESEEARKNEDPESEEVSERDRLKAASWDDWKDANPKGWGNTKRI